MKVRYFEDTDAPHIELREAAVAETRDLDENTLIDMDDDTLRGQALLTAAFGVSDNDDRLRMLSRWATEQSEGLELLVPSLPDSTRDRARRAITEYIEVFYNRQRLHSGLGYRTPHEITEQYAKIARQAA